MLTMSSSQAQGTVVELEKQLPAAWETHGSAHAANDHDGPKLQTSGRDIALTHHLATGVC